MKYRFTGEEKFYVGIKLKRIIRISDGLIGGWIEKEENLSQDGDCWIYDNAQVFWGARVFDNAVISENARVFDNAVISENAIVYGNAMVYGNARVYGDAKVYGNARVYGDAKVYGDAIVYGNALVYGDAKVFGNALVPWNARVTTNLTKDLVNILGLKYEINITDDHIKIGCQCHTKKQWKDFSDEEINIMDKGALEWWNKYKTIILKLAE